MMKYLQQKPDQSNCGPIAIFNTMVWLGRKPCLKELERECKLSPKDGTRTINVTRALKKYRVRFKYYSHIKTEDIIKALRQGRAVIYLYAVSPSFNHFVLFVDAIKKQKYWHFCTINDAPFKRNKLVRTVPVSYYTKKIVKLGPLFRSQGHCNPRVWIITKKVTKI